MKEFLHTLLKEYNEIKSVKTDILETQDCLVDCPEYNDEIDQLFYEVDDALQSAKDNLNELYNIISKISSNE